MTKKICGWYRIGIVLSIIWVFLVSGIAIYECFRDRKVPLESGFIGIITKSILFNVNVVEDKKEKGFVLDKPAPGFLKAAATIKLPAGFVLDKPNLPEGFVLDEPIGFIPLSPSTKYELKFKTKRFLSVLFLPILGMWGLLLGFSSKRILSMIKTFFKNIRVGIILIFVGIFIPTVVYPLTEPMKKVKDTVEYRIKISKGKEIHYKLNELELVLNAQQFAIPYKYFVVSGIVLVFIGTGICVLNKDKKTTTTKNDNSIVTGNNSN